MLDADLAELYGVETFNLNKAVKRNVDRLPEDFMFQLTKEDADSVRFQIGMSQTSGRGGRRYLPHAFTEQGVAMLSRSQQQTRSPGQFRHHAGLCEAARDDSFAQRSCREVACPGNEI